MVDNSNGESNATAGEAVASASKNTKNSAANKKRGKKKPKKQTSAAKSSAVGRSVSSQHSSRIKRPYPSLTLEDSLSVPQAIKEHNHGKPWDTAMVAKATLNVKPSANKFFYLAAASRDYGLTLGTRDTATIEITPLGEKIVFAKNDEERSQAQIEAFLSIDIFSKVYNFYSGSAHLPTDKEFLSNALTKEFSLPGEFHDEFVKLFRANCKFLDIENGLRRQPGRVKFADVEAAQTADIRVVGEPKGKFDRTAFIIMPFVEKGQSPRPPGYFQEVLKSLVTPAANAAGFAVETANQHGSDVIQSTIINKLLAANLVIADLTDHNPNVLFELGVRLAKELPVALVKAEGTGPIFDVDNMMRVRTYSANLWATTIEKDVPKLTDHFKAPYDNAATERTYMTILTGHAAHSG